MLCNFYFIFVEISICKHCSLIRRRVLWHLIWVCTVCLSLFNGTLGHEWFSEMPVLNVNYVIVFSAKHNVLVYLEDSIAQLLEQKEENPKINPTKILSE